MNTQVQLALITAVIVPLMGVVCTIIINKLNHVIVLTNSTLSKANEKIDRLESVIVALETVIAQISKSKDRRLDNPKEEVISKVEVINDKRNPVPVDAKK